MFASPIPHPLAWWSGAPEFLVEALEWVVGVEWPEGNEKLVWDLADRWYAAGKDLAGPIEAITRGGPSVVAGWGGVDTELGDLTDQIWRYFADDPQSGLAFLAVVLNEIGDLADRAGCDIEGAKIEMYVELGFMLFELAMLAAAAFATAGAASAAGPAVIAAGRWAIQRVFKELLQRMLSRSLKSVTKEAVEAAAKKFTRANLKQLGRMSLKHSVREGAEEVAIEYGTQVHQIDAGRREDGFDTAALGLSAVGGAAGGAFAGLAGLGPHAHTGLGRTVESLGRGAAGEAIAETGARLVTGQGLPSLSDVGHALTSGARSGMTGHTTDTLNDIGNDIRGNLDQLDARSQPGTGASFVDRTPDLGSSHGIDLDSPPATYPSAAAHTDADMSFAGTTYTSAAYVGGYEAGTVHSGGPPGFGVDASVHSGIADRSPADTAPVQGAVSGSGPATSGPDLAGVVSASPTAAGLDLASLTPSGIPQEPGPSGIPHQPAPSGIASQAGPPGPTAFSPTTAPPVPTAPATSGPPPVHPLAVPTASGLAAPTTPAPNATIGPVVPTRPTFGPTIGPDSPRLSPAPDGRRPRYEGEDKTEYLRLERVRAWGEYECDRRGDHRSELLREAEVVETARRDTLRRLRLALDDGNESIAGRLDQLRLDQLHQVLDLEEQADNAHRDPVGVTTVPDGRHRRLNLDYADIVTGGIDTDDRSALTGTGHPPPAEHSRAYFERGGHRPPLRWDQALLERLLPRDASGRPVRFASVFGEWFTRLNDSGPGADPTRGINCVDCVMSFVDTWFHGRPRVSAPRTFDAYLDGQVRQPLHGEIGGMRRISQALGVPFTTTYSEASGYFDTAEATLHQRFRELERSLLYGGPGSVAVLAHEYRDGGSHAWIAINEDGRVLYLDPQHGTVDTTPPYHSQGPKGGITRLDVAAITADGHRLHLIPDTLQRPWEGGDPAGPKSRPGGAHGREPLGQPRRPASVPQPPAPEPGSLRERLLRPYDPQADPPTAAHETPTPQPWDAWKSEEGARMQAASIAAVADEYGLRGASSQQALQEAYELTRDYIAPFVVQVAVAMLQDFRLDVAANPDHKIVFVGRDGDSLALAVQQLDPQFYADHCTQISLSRRLGMLSILGRETLLGRELVPDGIRWDFGSEPIPPTNELRDAVIQLRQHLQKRGVPIQRGGSVTLVDSSFKGTVQEMLAAIYPRAQFKGAYIWHGQHRADPHPGTKTGYATSLGNPRQAGSLDPAWETLVYEYLLRGPLSSPVGYDRAGNPIQVPESSKHNTAYGKVYEDKVTPGFRNDRRAPGRTRLRDAVLDVNRSAITDYAQHIATVASPEPELLARFDAYRRLVYNWDQVPLDYPPRVPRRLIRFLDSFSPGTDSGRRDRKPDP